MPGAGLSPHLWGTRLRCWGGPKPQRFIPTPVGNTASLAALADPITVYPHTCGEHADVQRLLREDIRFIPTPVGNTERNHSAASPDTVYPHTCGEHTLMPWPIQNATGLSPHLWGTLFNIDHQAFGFRFIPTPVGNTSPLRSAGARAAVYPHTCGEHVTVSEERSPKAGLSPHLWGTPACLLRRQPLLRFIPTPVGNTFRVQHGRSTWTVYPHTCGEHLRSLSVSSPFPGLSPHLWGTLVLVNQFVA